MSFSNQIIDFEALLYALAQQAESLPESIQHPLTEVGQHLHRDQLDSTFQLQVRELIQKSPSLEAAYQKALLEWDANYTSQERTKSLNATFHQTSELGNLFLNRVALSKDWVVFTKDLAHKQNATQTPSQFWDKTDRIAVMTAGGIALGSAIAQLPGAVIGGLLGAGSGWYMGFVTTTDRKSSKTKIESQNIELIANNPDRSINFYDLPTEQLAMIAQSATKDAVKDLHQKGISTYGMRDGVIHETNPNNDPQSVLEKDRQH
jgi:hypothetical protein